MAKCIVHRASDEWSSRFPGGKPEGVVQWEDDARFFLRFAARELRPPKATRSRLTQIATGRMR